MFNFWGVSHHQSTFRFPHHSAAQTRPPRRDRPGRKLRGFPKKDRGWGGCLEKTLLWSASQSFCLGETISEILCFFLILKSRRKKIKIRLQNLVQTKQKNLRVLHFFGVFCDPSSTFPSKTGKLQGSPEGVKRSQFFEPVVTMGLVPPGQSCTESFRRILGVEMVTGGKVGKCNDSDDCQKNLGFFCWGGGGYHLQMWMYHLQMWNHLCSIDGSMRKLSS